MSLLHIEAERTERAQVVAEAREWLGTPYHHHGRVKGPQGGVDCLMLLAEVFERCGLVARVEPGSYAHDWHLHRSEERYMQGLTAYATRLPAEQAVPQVGDIALFKFGRTFSHAGIVSAVPPGGRLGSVELIHAYIGRGVILSRLQDEPIGSREHQFWSHW